MAVRVLMADADEDAVFNDVTRVNQLIADQTKENLESVSLVQKGLNADGVRHLVATLKKQKGVKSLDLTGNAVKDEGISVLCGLLESNSRKGARLTDLNLSDTATGMVGAKLLAETMKQATSMRFLDLSDNAIGPLPSNGANLAGIQAMCDVLKYCNHLHTLRLRKIRLNGSQP